MNNEEIKTNLINNGNLKLKAFTNKLVPLTNYKILGLNISYLRQLAQKVVKEKSNELFFEKYDIQYYEEILLFGLVIYYSKPSLDEFYKQLDHLIPYMDCWAHTDVICIPKKLEPYYQDIISHYEYLKSSEEEIKQRMFGLLILKIVQIQNDYVILGTNHLMEIKSVTYYSMMMISWCLATFLIYDFDYVYQTLNEGKFSSWIIHKSIQKALESRRIDEIRKNILRENKKLLLEKFSTTN